MLRWENRNHPLQSVNKMVTSLHTTFGKGGSFLVNLITIPIILLIQKGKNSFYPFLSNNIQIVFLYMSKQKSLSLDKPPNFLGVLRLIY